MRKVLIFLVIGGFFCLAAPAFAANGTISGTVTRAANGAAIASMVITATDTTTGVASVPPAVTAADGTYSLTVAPGTYDVSTYFYAMAANTEYIKQTKTVTVGSGETVTNQNFSLSQRGVFSGHIYAADGVTPISGAAITVTNSRGTTFGYAWGAISLSNGSYTTMPTPTDYTLPSAGTYSFTVTKAGYFLTTVTGVTLTDDATITKDITMTPASTVSGTVRDANGTAIANATVTLTKTTGSATYTSTTDAGGSFTVSVYDILTANGTAVSDYTISIRKDGYVTKTGSMSISVDASTVTGSDFTLTTGKILSGTITNTAGTPLSTAVISLYKRNKPRSPLADFSYTTASDGAYSFASLPAGNYRVQITRSGYVTTVVDLLTIKSATTSKTYKLESAGSMTGLIYTGKSSGIDGATVAVFALKNGKYVSYTSTTADDTGNYTVNGLKTGTYRLKISSTDYVTQLINVAVKSGKTAKKNIKLAAAGSVEGYLTDKETGLPLSFMYVRVVGTSVTTASDMNGYYVLDGIAPGTRKVTVISSLYDIPKQIGVKVAAGKTKTGVNFTLTPKQ